MEIDQDVPDMVQTPSGWLATRDDFPRIGVMGETREGTEQKFRKSRQAWRDLATSTDG